MTLDMVGRLVEAQSRDRQTQAFSPVRFGEALVASQDLLISTAMSSGVCHADLDVPGTW